MKFFQKRWVALILCAVMIAAAFGISRQKQASVSYQPSDSHSAEEWGEDHYGSYTRYILDEADLFSDSTVRRISEYNAGFDYAYGSICGVATVSELDGQDIEDAAYDAADEMGLGGNDYLLLLDEDTEDWYFVYGEDASYYVDNRLEILVTGEMDTVFRDTNDAMVELFDDLEDWYANTVPPADGNAGGTESGMVVGGTFLFIALIVLLIMLSLISSAVRAGRRIVGGWWPVFFGRRYYRSHVHHTPPPGPRPGPRPNPSSGRGRSGGFGGSSRGNFGRGGGFGGGSRSGGFGGKR